MVGARTSSRADFQKCLIISLSNGCFPNKLPCGHRQQWCQVVSTRQHATGRLVKLVTREDYEEGARLPVCHGPLFIQHTIVCSV